MAGTDWHKCKFLESGDNLKPLVKKRFGRQPSSSLTRQIVACLQQGRLFYEAAAAAPLEIRPLQQFYGMVGFAKALVVARNLRSLATLRPVHGLSDISDGNSRITNLRLKIEGGGTFHEFNDVVAEQNRLCYIDEATRWRMILLPSAKSAQLSGLDLSLRDILSRVPGLESLYQMTLAEDSQTDPIQLETSLQGDDTFRIIVSDSQLFTDRESLRAIVRRWRSRYPAHAFPFSPTGG